MWQGLKPDLFLIAFAARLKSCPVTKLTSTESLLKPETLSRHESSNAITLRGSEVFWRLSECDGILLLFRHSFFGWLEG